MKSRYIFLKLLLINRAMVSERLENLVQHSCSPILRLISKFVDEPLVPIVLRYIFHHFKPVRYQTTFALHACELILNRNGSTLDLHHYSASESSDTDKLSLEQHLNTILNEIGCEFSEEIQNMVIIALEGIGIICPAPFSSSNKGMSILLLESLLRVYPFHNLLRLDRKDISPCKYPR